MRLEHLLSGVDLPMVIHERNVSLLSCALDCLFCKDKKRKLTPSNLPYLAEAIQPVL